MQSNRQNVKYLDLGTRQKCIHSFRWTIAHVVCFMQGRSII